MRAANATAAPSRFPAVATVPACIAAAACPIATLAAALTGAVTAACGLLATHT